MQLQNLKDSQLEAIGLMPIRYVRKTLTSENVLNVAVVTTSVAKELANITNFPPAQAAATILLGIFETIQVSTPKGLAFSFFEIVILAETLNMGT